MSIVLMAIAMCFVPDSPRHLVHVGKEEAARKSLRWLRGSEYSAIEEELKALQNAEEEHMHVSFSNDAVVSPLDLFTKAVYLKPFAISLALNFLYQFTGINQVSFHLQDIFSKAGSDLDAGLCGSIVTFAQVK